MKIPPSIRRTAVSVFGIKLEWEKKSVDTEKFSTYITCTSRTHKVDLNMIKRASEIKVGDVLLESDGVMWEVLSIENKGKTLVFHLELRFKEFYSSVSGFLTITKRPNTCLRVFDLSQVGILAG